MPYQYRREPLTVDESNALVQACRTSEEKLVIWSLLDTGMRVSELATLDKDRMDFQLHQVMVYGKGKVDGKRMSKRRVLKVSARLRQILEPHLIAHDQFGMSVSKIQRIVKRVANRAKIRRATSPHVLRHTFAVSALRSGVNLVVLQKWLGHEKLETTALYLNLSPDEVMREVEEKMF